MSPFEPLPTTALIKLIAHVYPRWRHSSAPKWSPSTGQVEVMLPRVSKDRTEVDSPHDDSNLHRFRVPRVEIEMGLGVAACVAA